MAEANATEPRGRARRSWTLSVVAVCGVVAVTFAAQSCQSPRKGAQSANRVRAVVGEVQASVDCEGEIDAVRSVMITSPLRGDRGRIVWLASDGSMVQAGDKLVQFDASPFEEDLRRAQARVGEAEAALSSALKALDWEQSQAERDARAAAYELRAAQLDLDNAEYGEGALESARLSDEASQAAAHAERVAGYLRDLEGIAQRGLISDAEVQLAREQASDASAKSRHAADRLETFRERVLPARLERARLQVAKAQANVDQGARALQLREAQARAAIDAAESALRLVNSEAEVARAALDATTIVAPGQGMVVLREEYRVGERRKPRLGDTVFQNQPIIALPDLSEFALHARVREDDMHAVRVGATCKLTVAAFPDEPLTGVLHAIGTMAEARPGQEGKSFQVTIRIRNGHERLRPGMTAHATILSEATTGVVVPIAALRFDASGYWVMLEHDGRPTRRNVRVGVRGDQQAQISEGLNDQDTVLLPELW